MRSFEMRCGLLVVLISMVACHSDEVLVQAHIAASEHTLRTEHLEVQVWVDGDLPPDGFVPMSQEANVTINLGVQEGSHEFQIRVRTEVYGDSVYVLESDPKTQTVTGGSRVEFGPADFRVDADGADGDGVPSWEEFQLGCHPTMSDCFWRSVSAGMEHTCAIDIDHQIYCWGQNDSGQLGTDDTQNLLEPTTAVVGTAFEWQSVVTGNGHTCAIDQNDNAYCWGAGSGGQLGTGSSSDVHHPSPVAGSYVFAMLAAAGETTCGIEQNGALYCWGNDVGDVGEGFHDEPSSVGSSQNWGSVAVGVTHVCGVLEGRIWCWGYNTDGQIGIAPSDPDPEYIAQASRVEVSHPEAAEGRTWLQVVAGAYNTCAIDDQRSLYCWGDDSNDKLQTTPDEPHIPTKIDSGPDRQWIAVSVGEEHICGTLSDYKLECWGWNKQGRVGVGYVGVVSGRETPFLGENAIIRVSAGVSHTCAVHNGSLYCWGAHGRGKTGLNASAVVDTIGTSSLVAEPSSFGDANWLAVSAGLSHTCALGTNDSVHCWGDNSYGALGNGTTRDFAEPFLIDGLHVSDVQCGDEFTCALSTSGSLECWGQNHYGQIGTADLDDRVTPHSVPHPLATTAPQSWIDFAVGSHHVCALLTDSTTPQPYNGGMFCWGRNNDNELGLGLANTADYGLPEAPLENRPWDDVIAGRGFTCGLSGDNYVDCWGLNDSGQLGFGDTTAKGQPADANTQWVNASGATNFSGLTAGGVHACGLMAGAPVCWGGNDAGQIGNNTTTPAPLPASPSTAANLDILAAGGEHTCGIDSDGSLYCWGSNNNGQLGLAEPDGSSNPIATGSGYGFTQIALGGQHTCGLTDADPPELHCWGSNEVGQLGTGDAWADSPQVVNRPEQP